MTESGTKVHLIPNGGPADEVGCCICCNATGPYVRPQQFAHVNPYVPPFASDFPQGYSCYNGCCACTTVTSLSFEMHSCKTTSSLNYYWQLRYPTIPSPEGPLQLRECDNQDGAFPMTFEMTKQVDTCYATQAMANNPDATEEYRQEHNISWSAPPEYHWNLTNTQACNVQSGYGVFRYGTWNDLPDEIWDTEYTDPDKKNTTSYPEAWGFSGNVCSDINTTPNRPGYSYPGSCDGQAIVASLCCCKTGVSGTGGVGQSQAGAMRPACPRWNGIAGSIDLDPTANTYENYTNYINQDGRGGCSMGCFTFTIQPDHKYKHSFKVLAQDLTTDYNDWILVDSEDIGEDIYTSCSPCVYKQGECEGRCMGPGSTFNPSMVGNIAMNVGTMTPLRGTINVPTNTYAFPKTTYTTWNGQNFLLSGQCNDGKDGDQKMRMLVAGAYLTNCDCQTGWYRTCDKLGSLPDEGIYYVWLPQSVCYGDESFSYYTSWPTNLKQIQCWDDPDCDTCLEIWVDEDGISGMPGGTYGLGKTLAGSWGGLPGGRNTTFPCWSTYPPWPNPPCTEDCTHPWEGNNWACGTMEERIQYGPGYNVPPSHVGGQRQTAEIDPEDWETDEGHPFGGNAEWFFGGRDKNGTHPTENSEWDREKWAYIYCAEDEENEESCGSLCEYTNPVIMWYTGIIEET